jgi:hypothetical protein
MIATIVDWGALGRVVLYSLIAGVGVPAVYAMAVFGAGRSSDAQRARRGVAATVYGVLALAGIAACLAAIVLGIVLLTHKG